MPFASRSRLATLLTLCTASFAMWAGISSNLHAEPSAPTTAPADGAAVALPEVGKPYPSDIELAAVDGTQVRLSTIASKRHVVLIFLRGYPGYQCPICTKQVASLVAKAKAIDEIGADVLMIYPGPAAELQKHAAEFAGAKDLPKHFKLALDPDYVITNAYGLRWDAPGETAYPSTFVVERGTPTVRYAKISHTHGDRAPVGDVLNALNDLPK